MSNRRVKEGNFINIQSFMVNDLDLSGAELLTYAIIYGFTQDGKQWYEEGLNYICNWVGRNKNTVCSIIDKFEKLGYIEKESKTISDGNTIFKTIKVRVTYDASRYKRDKEKELSNKYARNSARDIAKQQVLKICKELDIENRDCRTINTFLDNFITFYNNKFPNRKFSFQSKSSMKNFVQRVDSEICCLEENELLEILNMYFEDVDKFEERGIVVSIHHMVSDGILDNYIRRLM